MYICIEGIDGVGKSTLVQALCESFVQKYGIENVVQTSEPGSTQIPSTMKLRKLMLDVDCDSEMTITAREYIAQATRSINLERIVIPALLAKKIVIQDRGLLSGFAYGIASGNSKIWLQTLANETCAQIKKIKPNVYDFVVLLETNNSKACLQRAQSKQEYKSGDVMESKGESFMKEVHLIMQNTDEFLTCPLLRVNIDDKNIQQIHDEIWQHISIN